MLKLLLALVSACAVGTMIGLAEAKLKDVPTQVYVWLLGFVLLLLVGGAL